MTDEEKAKAAYEKEAKNWPKHVEWDALPKSTKFLWIQRAKERKHDD